jgi:hypothetical protein
MKYLYFLLDLKHSRNYVLYLFLISLLDHPCNTDSFYSFFPKFYNKDDMFEKSRSLDISQAPNLFLF